MSQGKPAEVFRLWVVYDKPSDYPMGYVARLWHADAPTETLIVTPEYLIIENMMLTMGLYKLNRAEIDDPHIMEVWI